MVYIMSSVNDWLSDGLNGNYDRHWSHFSALLSHHES